MREADQIVAEIKSALMNMKPLLMKAGVQERYFNIHDEANQLTIRELRDAKQWLKNFFALEYHKMKEIRGLQSEEIWENVDLFDLHRSYEYKLWKEAAANARKVFTDKTRPLFFRKTFITRELIRRRHAAKETPDEIRMRTTENPIEKYGF